MYPGWTEACDPECMVVDPGKVKVCLCVVHIRLMRANLPPSLHKLLTFQANIVQSHHPNIGGHNHMRGVVKILGTNCKKLGLVALLFYLEQWPVPRSQVQSHLLKAREFITVTFFVCFDLRVRAREGP